MIGEETAHRASLEINDIESTEVGIRENREITVGRDPHIVDVRMGGRDLRWDGVRLDYGIRCQVDVEEPGRTRHIPEEGGGRIEYPQSRHVINEDGLNTDELFSGVRSFFPGVVLGIWIRHYFAVLNFRN